MPSRDQVARALAIIKRGAEYDYFFDHLNSPDWLEPLAEANRFRTPPEPVHEGQYVRFPSWCESRYLVRVAGQASERVAKIIKAIPVTENVRVHEDYVDAALAMPANVAVKLVGQAKQWAQSPYPTLLPERLGKLVAHLARGGITNQAIGLARVILAPQPDPRAAEKAEYRLSLDPQARFAAWDYERILQDDIPVLVAAAGVSALDLLCELLEEALKLTHENYAGPNDLTFVWRPAIEDNPQNHPVGLHGVRESLIIAVRDAAENLIQNKLASVDDIVDHLGQHNWQVFERITLHVLRLFAPDSAMTAERLSNRALFDAGAFHHEYVLLAEEAFAQLPETVQEKILNWGDEGPDIEQFKEGYEHDTGSPASEEIITNYMRHWRSKQFNTFRSAVPSHLIARHPWLADLDTPSEDDAFVAVMHSWTGPQSPIALDDIESKSVEEIVEYLATWRPPQEIMAPSPEGLARILAEAVSRTPDRFARNAQLFQNVDEAYLAGLLQGWDKAVQTKSSVDWSPVLESCADILVKTNTHLDAGASQQDRSWVRQTMAWLLYRGLSESDAAVRIPYECRKQVWKLLYMLANDPDPSVGSEQEYGVRNQREDGTLSWDPAQYAINTVRGEAMHAVIQYALWVREHLEEAARRPTRLRSFAQMREVERVLNRHLSTQNDQSLAIRSVYGQRLPALAYLAPRWVMNNVLLIFPEESEHQNFRDAAWQTYIRFSRPYISLFRLLHNQYEWAVQEISNQPRTGATDPQGAAVRLGQHLLAYYWQGHLPLETGGLLGTFFRRASSPLRARVLEFVGFSLHRSLDEKVDVPHDVIQRLKELWEWRITESSTDTAATGRLEEMSAFGDWFVFGPFDEAWALTQLAHALQLGSTIHAIPSVLDRLGQTVFPYPLLTIRCLRLMVENEALYSSVQVWQDRLEAILRPALQNDDANARQAARELINALGARGNRTIDRLLQEDRDNPPE